MKATINGCFTQHQRLMINVVALPSIIIIGFSTLAQVRRFLINSSTPGHMVLCLLFSQEELYFYLFLFAIFISGKQ